MDESYVKGATPKYHPVYDENGIELKPGRVVAIYDKNKMGVVDKRARRLIREAFGQFYYLGRVDVECQPKPTVLLKPVEIEEVGDWALAVPVPNDGRLSGVKVNPASELEIYLTRLNDTTTRADNIWEVIAMLYEVGKKDGRLLGDKNAPHNL